MKSCRALKTPLSQRPAASKPLTVKHLKVLASQKVHPSLDWRQAKSDGIVTGL